MSSICLKCCVLCCTQKETKRSIHPARLLLQWWRTTYFAIHLTIEAFMWSDIPFDICLGWSYHNFGDTGPPLSAKSFHDVIDIYSIALDHWEMFPLPPEELQFTALDLGFEFMYEEMVAEEDKNPSLLVPMGPVTNAHQCIFNFIPFWGHRRIFTMTYFFA